MDEANELLVMDSLDSRTLIEEAMQELVLEKQLVSITGGKNDCITLPWIVELERRLAEVLTDSVLNSPHLARLQAMPEDMVVTLMHEDATFVCLNDCQQKAILNASFRKSNGA